MALGFPAVVIFAWVYEITPEGLKPTDDVEPHESITQHAGQRLDRAIIALVGVTGFEPATSTSQILEPIVRSRSRKRANPYKHSIIIAFVVRVLPTTFALFQSSLGPKLGPNFPNLGPKNDQAHRRSASCVAPSPPNPIALRARPVRFGALATARTLDDDLVLEAQGIR